jgi:hypothetical protein
MGSLLEDANHGQFESIGGISGMWLPTPRNDMSWKGERMIPLPVCMDMGTELIKDTDRLERANVLSNMTKFNSVSFTSVVVDRGEIPSNTIDYTSTQQKYLMFKPSSDGRIIEETYDWREVIKYKFPRWGILRNGLDDSAKRILSMIGLFMNGDNSLKEGTLMPVGMGLISPVNVKYAKTKLNEQVIVKEGSDTVTDPSKKLLQKPKVGAGITGQANVTEDKPRSNEVVSPPVKKDVPVDSVVVDAIDGVDSTEAVSSEGSSSSEGDSATQVKGDKS